MWGLSRLGQHSVIMVSPCTTALRVCQVNGLGRGGGIVDLLELPRSADESEAPLMADLDPILMRGQFLGQQVGLLLDAPMVEFQELRVPTNLLKRPPEEVQSALAWELGRDARLDGNALEVRYWHLPPGHSEGHNVMTVAVPRVTTESVLEAVDNSHYELSFVTVEPLALAACAQASQLELGSSESWGILDLGAKRATLTVMAGSTPIYVRTLGEGVHRWAERVGRAFRVEGRAARSLLAEHGVLSAERHDAEVGAASDSDGAYGGASTAVMSGVRIADIAIGALGSTLDELAQQVGVCFTYVAGNFPQFEAKRILLAGGGAQTPGVAAHLQERLGVSVTPLVDALPDGLRSRLSSTMLATWAGARLALESRT